MKKIILLFLWIAVAIPYSAKSQCALPPGCPSGELVCNGDFEAGDTCFTSGLPSAGFCMVGSYFVTSQATLGVGVGKCSAAGWMPGMLALGGIGNYMVVDGQTNVVVWRQNVNVVMGAPTCFSFWVLRTVSTNNTGPNLNISLGGVPIGASLTGTYSPVPGVWTNFAVQFISPVGGNVQLVIRQGAQVGAGDFGIDQISLQQSLPQPILNIADLTPCPNDSAFVMHDTILPAGYVSLTYTGDLSGIDTTTHTFNPATATPGSNVFTACYNFIGGQQCCSTYTIDIMPPPPVTTTLSLVRCETASPITLADQTGGMINVTPYGFFSPDAPIGSATFTASPGPGLTVPPGTGNVTFDPDPTNVGTNLITYTVTGANGCERSAIGSITVCPVPSFTISPATTCSLPTTITASTIPTMPGGCGPTYSWTGPPGGILGASNLATVNATLPGTYTLTVTTAPTVSCSYSQSVTLQPLLPITISTSDPTLCKGDSAVLTANSASALTSYSWTYNGNPLPDTTQSITVVLPGTYCVTGYNGPCSTAVACFNVVNINIPPINVTGNDSICENESAVLNVSISGNCSSPTVQWLADGVPIPGATTSTLNIAANTYPAGTVISVTVCCSGCCETVQAAIITDTPDYIFPPIPTIDICTWNGTPVQIIASSPNGTNCIFGGVGIVNSTLGLFDPIAAGGPGTYTISYSCEINGCRTYVTQDVTVVENDYWHQTTENAFQRDIGNDVITDAQGNVYITGLYVRYTTFNGGGNPDISVAAGAPGSFSFVAKYDNCGNLIWVAYAVSNAAGHQNFGNSITLDEINGLVYAAGGFDTHIIYMGGDGSSQFALTTGNRGYVASFNMSDGHIHYVQPIVINSYTNATAITVNQNNGKIYVGGHHNGTTPPMNQRVYVQRYTPTLLGLGPIEYQINASGNGNSYVNDMDYDENPVGTTLGNLWLIGDYTGNLTFPPTSVINTSTIGTDAYIARFVDNVAPTFNLGLLKKGNMTGAGAMTGKGISVNSSSHQVYVTGDYSNINVTSVFQLGSQNLPNSSGGFNAYFMALHPNGLNVWSVPNYGEANGKMIQGKSVTNTGTRAYFTGWFNGNSIFAGNPPSPGIIGYTGTSMPHTFAVGYNALTGVGLWKSTTVDPVTNSSHVGNSIAADATGHAFITGYYSGQMGYFPVTTPSSGILTSSGAGAFNAFTMRVMLNTGELKTTEAENTEILSAEATDVSVYPNPTNANVTVDIKNFNENETYTLAVYNSTGALVKQLTVTNSQTVVDLTNVQNGIYLFNLTNGTTTQVVRIAKTN